VPQVNEHHAVSVTAAAARDHELHEHGVFGNWRQQLAGIERVDERLQCGSNLGSIQGRGSSVPPDAFEVLWVEELDVQDAFVHPCIVSSKTSHVARALQRLCAEFVTGP
jgi:hypothetical protein